MEKPRVRAPAFTDQEDEALIKAYSKNRNLIRGRNSMGVSQRTRNEAWDAVARAVNDADGRCERTVKSVKIHYGNMLAEYKAFKSNDRTSRNSHQNPQPFFKFFDELFGEKSADSSGGFDVSGEDYSVDGYSDEFAGPNGQSQLLAALCGGDAAARYANGGNSGSALNALMNSVQAVVENGGSGEDGFLQVANYLSVLPGGGHLKPEPDYHHHQGGSDSERTSAATSSAANTPPAVYIQNNNGNGSAPHNFAALLSGGLMNGGAANGKPAMRQPLAKKRRGSNASAVAGASYPAEVEMADKTGPTASGKATSDDAEERECQRRISALRVKILEKELSVFEWKEETLRKKSRLLDLKIANQLRAAGGGGVEKTPDRADAAGASDSMDTTAAFEKSAIVVVKNDIVDDEPESGSAETETGSPPPRKLARLAGESVEPPAAAVGDGAGQPNAVEFVADDEGTAAHSDESTYSLLNSGNLVISNSHTSLQ